MSQQEFFCDLRNRYARIDALGDPLMKLNEVVNGRLLLPRQEGVCRKGAKEHKLSAGRKPWDALQDSDNAGREVWADQACCFHKQAASLKAGGCRIIRRSIAGRELTKRQISANLRNAKVRCQVEHVFVAQINDMGGTLVRSIGIVQAKVCIGIKNLAYNMRRLVYLEREAFGGYLRGI